MERYFIEKQQKSVVTDELFGEVERLDVIETSEYSDRESWEKAKQQLEIPHVCWVEKGDLLLKAYVKYE